MTSPPPLPESPPQRWGRWMTLSAWLGAILLLTLLFQGVLDGQHNPSPLSTAGPEGGAEVVLQRNRAGHYLVDGEIDGYPVTFLVDTGATDVAIPGSVAERIGLRSRGLGTARTAGGDVETHRARIAHLRIHSIELADLSASIVPEMPGEEVLLGMAALKRLELTQRGDRLTLRPL